MEVTTWVKTRLNIVQNVVFGVNDLTFSIEFGLMEWFANRILFPLRVASTAKSERRGKSAGFTSLYSWISHDVTAAMLVSPNNEMAAMLVSRSNPPGIESYYYANVFFCFRCKTWLLITWVKPKNCKMVVTNIDLPQPWDTSWQISVFANSGYKNLLGLHNFL